MPTSAGFAPSGDAMVARESAGDGNRAVVFIHAGIADRRMWRHQLAAVPDGFRFVSLDLRGHGDTRLTDEPFSNHEDVLAVMDHLDIFRAVMVGCSMGGGTAIDVALAAPHRVDGLVLVGAASPGFEPDEYEPPQWPEILKAYEAGDMERVAELDAEVWVVGHGRDRSEVDEGVIAEMMEMDRIILPVEERRDELLLPIDPPRAERMDQIDVPVLVIVGEHDLPDVHLSAVHLAETRSHHDAVVIPGAAHLPSLEQPEAFNRALFGFLQAFSE
jgi:pimeloyl-ACP methyl ester carboxylesterase